MEKTLIIKKPDGSVSITKGFHLVEKPEEMRIQIIGQVIESFAVSTLVCQFH